MFIQLFCGDGEYNTIAPLYLSTPEDSIKKLYHENNCMSMIAQVVCLCVRVCLYLSVFISSVCQSAKSSVCVRMRTCIYVHKKHVCAQFILRVCFLTQ